MRARAGASALARGRPARTVGYFGRDSTRCGTDSDVHICIPAMHGQSDTERDSSGLQWESGKYCRTSTSAPCTVYVNIVTHDRAFVRALSLFTTY